MGLWGSIKKGIKKAVKGVVRVVTNVAKAVMSVVRRIVKVLDSWFANRHSSEEAHDASYSDTEGRARSSHS